MSDTHYRCDICGAVGPWSREWAWYGSYREYEYHGECAVLLTCSQKCRDDAGGRIAQLQKSKAKANRCGKVPRMPYGRR